MSRSPFKFLDSYTREDKNIFFGRETEVEDVYTKIFQGKLLVVYGASGSGKSSLISCGLANKFQDADWLPINVRRGNDINISLFQQLEKYMLTPMSFSHQVPTVKMLKSIYLDHFKPIFLVFDQFEELFIFGDRPEWSEFIAWVKEVINSELLVRFVFVIRGEYLEYLTEFENILPEVFSNKIRIEKMTRANAVRCITGPCAISTIAVEESFPENLLVKLSPNKAEIELTYLQVFLDRIYKKASEESGNSQITFSNQLLEKLGNVGDVLSQFLDEQIKLISDGESALAILKAFVSTDATKKQISEQQAAEFVKTIGKDFDEKKVENIIQELVSRRILKDQDESGHYELRHDSLAAKIFEKITIYERELIEVNQFITYAFGEYKKRGFLLNESDLAYIAPFENKLQFSVQLKDFLEKSKAAVRKKNRSRKQFYAVMGIISFLLLTSILGLVYSQMKKREADSNATLAKEQSTEALRQKELADQQRSLAEEKQLEADKQANIAREQSALALTQKQEAERQRALANSLRQNAEAGQREALEQKENADAAKLEAERYAQLADKNADAATSERDNAARYRMLAIAQAMGSKSVQLLDPDQKMLVAQQAFLFNKQYAGYPFQADIYSGLYSALKAINGDNFNVRTIHRGAIKGLALIDGNSCVTVGSDGKIMATNLDAAQGTAPRGIDSPYIFQCIDIDTDRRWLATGSVEGNILLYSYPGLEKIKDFPAQRGSVWAVAFDAQHNLYSATNDRKILKWDVENATSTEVFTANSQINSLDFNDRGNTLAIGTTGGEIILLNVAGPDKKSFVKIPTANSVTKVKFNNDGSILGIGHENGTVTIWDVKNSETLQSLTGHRSIVSDLRFRDDGLFLFSASYDGTAMVWNMRAMNQRQIVLADHGGWVLQVAFDQAGQNLVTADATGALRLFPLNMEVYASRVCEKLKRDMTQKEWENFVGEDISYRKTCQN